MNYGWSDYILTIVLFTQLTQSNNIYLLGRATNVGISFRDMVIPKLKLLIQAHFMKSLGESYGHRTSNHQKSTFPNTAISLEKQLLKELQGMTQN